MADFQKKDNSGALFKNSRKEKETHPDYEGSIVVDGVDHWIKGWLKQGAKGTFMSLSVTPKQERAQEIRRNAMEDEINREAKYHPLDDDIPFAPEWR
jgi:hypothetical protein